MASIPSAASLIDELFGGTQSVTSPGILWRPTMVWDDDADDGTNDEPLPSDAIEDDEEENNEDDDDEEFEEKDSETGGEEEDI